MRKDSAIWPSSQLSKFGYKTCRLAILEFGKSHLNKSVGVVVLLKVIGYPRLSQQRSNRRKGERAVINCSIRERIRRDTREVEERGKRRKKLCPTFK
jgi:hypothetical protein